MRRATNSATVNVNGADEQIFADELLLQLLSHSGL